MKKRHKRLVFIVCAWPLSSLAHGWCWCAFGIIWFCFLVPRRSLKRSTCGRTFRIGGLVEQRVV